MRVKVCVCACVCVVSGCVCACACMCLCCLCERVCVRICSVWVCVCASSFQEPTCQTKDQWSRTVTHDHLPATAAWRPWTSGFKKCSEQDHGLTSLTVASHPLKSPVLKSITLQSPVNTIKREEWMRGLCYRKQRAGTGGEKDSWHSAVMFDSNVSA